MRKNIFAFVVASAVAFTVACLPLATPVTASSCDDIKFIFARGSGQTLGGNEYNAFKDSIEQELSYYPGLDYSFYELGSETHGGAKYSAVALDTLSTIGAKVSAGKGFSFGESVRAGETELKAYISEVSAICQNTMFVLGGYSQGAMVMTETVPELDASKVLYLATFGDPYLYLPEGAGLIPDACRGVNLSDYRAYAPNCYTYAGVLGAKKPYEPADWAGKIGLWCNESDFMCGGNLKMDATVEGGVAENIVQNALEAGHLRYVSDGHFRSAAQIIAEKIRENFDLAELTYAPYSNQDTVFLIDRTASMYSQIEFYKREALRLAEETINRGGRVALYTYGDLNDGMWAERDDVIFLKRLLDFDKPFIEFKAMLNQIEILGGGPDEEESALSAILGVMNRQEWQPGATKSIVLLTDAGYLSPDRDETTFEQVVKRSLEIDPVNIYVIDTNESLGSYESLVSATGGKLFDSTDAISTDYLLGRPSVTLSLSTYEGAAGDMITFAVTTSGEITSYAWDLDFDGVFETVTDTPYVSKVYSDATSGYIQVKATNSDGQFSTASAQVKIYDLAPNRPSIENLAVADDTASSATLSFELGAGTVASFVSINGTPIGVTTDNSLEVTDITEPTSVVLTPVGTNGRTGSPVEVILGARQSDGGSGGDSGNGNSNDGNSSGGAPGGESEGNRASESSGISAGGNVATEVGSDAREPDASAEATKILAPNSGKGR